MILGLKHRNRAKESTFTLFRFYVNWLVTTRSVYRERPLGMRGER